MKSFCPLFLLFFLSISLHAQKQHRDVSVYFDTAIYEINDTEKQIDSYF